MLELKNIKKNYISGNEKVRALKGINLNFRENEFVSILGQSGCGKTTLLNIIGGLDSYTSGDLIINGKSTKKYRAKDWDTYRNHSVGFVFQSYNLIPHQTVLSNVELALTLSGVSKEERRKRAIDVLTKVGLKEQMHKKPNQMSGGQMQRVAIARALVNDPDILLADEPTGALDSATSVQIMELLKEVSKDRLVIMVTHNPELAEKYSTRIINLLDGEVTSDSNPYKGKGKIKEAKKGKTSMSFLTALSLSLNNLMTKKGRTLLTAFAGSIGIIGIALIMSLSNGVQNYIDRVEQDTLSSYPLTIEKSSMDMGVMMEAVMGMQNSTSKDYKDGKVHTNAIMNDLLDMMSSKMATNNLEEFKKFLDSDKEIKKYINDVQYGYGLTVNVYNENSEHGIVKVNPTEIVEKMGMSDMKDMQAKMNVSETFGSFDVWTELLNNKDTLKDQYDLVKGAWPSKYNEVVLILDEGGNISDYSLYALGIMDPDELADKFNDLLDGKKVDKVKSKTYSYDELINMTFKLILPTDYYEKENDMWVDKSDDEEYLKKIIKTGEEIKVVGIIKPNEESIITNPYGGVGYTSDLQKHIMEKTNDTEIAKDQMENKDINVFTGLEFNSADKFDYSSLSREQQMYLMNLPQEEMANLINSFTENMTATYESNLQKLGIAELDKPSSINIYPKDFDAKEEIASLIDKYNQKQTDNKKDENVISYSDVVGSMMSSVTTIVDIVSYVLMAFVSVSLIVSSIMIGIITYISVLERTKEIGILRAIGASKKDISRVFNAETFIIGLVAGVLGIVITLLLNIPINMVLKNLIDVSNIASLPLTPALILIAISMILTVIAGLIPAKMASKKDPVEALRTE